MAIVRIDAYRSMAFGSITGAFQALGAPLTHNWRLLHLENNTDGDMIFSFDGVTENLFCPAGSYLVYDIATNSNSNVGATQLVFAKGTQFFVKSSTVPSRGAVYAMGFYAQGE